MSEDRPASGGAVNSTVARSPAGVEQQLATAQQLTHIGSWEWDARTNRVQWSDELYRIYGLEPQSCEITFASFLARVHPDDRARIENHVREAIRRPGRFEYPERIIRPDGSVRDLDSLGETILDEHGQPVGLIGTCRDVTEDRARDEKIRLYANIARNVQIGLCVWKVEDPEHIERATLVTSNPATERVTGMSLESRVGRPIFEVLPGTEGTALPALLAAVARDNTIREIADYPGPDIGGGPRVFSVKIFPLPGCCVGLALEDVTDRVRARELLAVEQSVLEMTAAGAGLEDTLTELVLAIERLSPGTMASIQRLDPVTARIYQGAAPHLPEAYNRAIDGVEIGPEVGSCGTSAYLRELVIVTDIETDARWKSYAAVALEHGLRACWSAPIIGSDGGVLGTFALYYRDRRSPTDADLELIARASHVAGIVIQRRLLDDQLRELSARLEAEREDERTGIAREIHDQLGQALTAIKLDLAWVSRRVATLGENEPVRGPVLDRVRGIAGMTDEVIEQVRRISSELRPGVLDDLGLLAAIEWRAQQFEQRTGVLCTVRSNLDDTILDRNLSTGLYRILQESLTNVARHANASHVEVRLRRHRDGLRFEVQDDGIGIKPDIARSPKALGLLGIRERARRLGGKVEFSSTPEGGTLVALEVPLPRASGEVGP